jgi:hypothetical protein
MKRRIQGFFVLVFALCSLGAKEGCSAPAGLSSLVIYCHTDPPVGCAAYCSGVNEVTFTPACTHISAGPLELAFEDIVISGVQELEAQGTQACPKANLSAFATPCEVGIIPQEWPNQDHEVGTPVPPGCPL